MRDQSSRTNSLQRRQQDDASLEGLTGQVANLIYCLLNWLPGCSESVTDYIMVAVQRESASRARSKKRGGTAAMAAVIVVLLLVLVGVVFRSSKTTEPNDGTTMEIIKARIKPQEVLLESPSSDGNANDKDALYSCPYTSFGDLTEDELHPKKGKRHMVTPPRGGPLTLVCCETTQGPWSIVVHERWAPLGAARFLEMVTSNYMNSEIPLFRCIKRFLCQFGLSSNASLAKEFDKSLKDDRNWLPEGKEHRQNEDGVKRFAQGYLAYAGSGENSRSKQLIISLTNVATLAGGSPWEVPWGELVGEHSFETLSKISTEYGDNGPSQGKLRRHGMTEEMRAEFSKMDYIKSCRVVDRTTQEEPY